MPNCTDKLYCCPAKEYFMKDRKTMLDSLLIRPRVVKFPNKFLLGHDYEKTVEITNKGLHPRFLNYTTDNNDITLEIYPRHMRNAFLGCDETVFIKIKIHTTHSKTVNNCRYIYVDARHPNLRFEIPILVARHEIANELPQQINFLPICPKNPTFYEMVIYNKSTERFNVTINSNCVQFKVLHITKPKIPPNDFTKVLMELTVRNKKNITGIIKIKLGQDIYKLIPIEHVTIPFSIHMQTRSVTFEALKFSQEATKTLSICNESNSVLAHKVCLVTPENMLNVFSPDNEKNLDALAYRHFHCHINSDCLPSNATIKCNITFRPVMHDSLYINENELPPFQVITGLKVTVQIDSGGTDVQKYTPKDVFVKVCGLIKGLELDIIPKHIDLPTVYFGEEHCMQIKVINVDGLNNLHVKPINDTQNETASIIITPPDGITLEPCQSRKFNVQFYATTLGKFVVKVSFKVVFGDIHSALIRGISQKVHCRAFPEMLSLGDIPIAIPQKRQITLINPLPVPIALQCSVQDDGNETPLVLNTHDVNENLPIHVLDPIQHIERCIAEEKAADENSDDRTVYEVVQGEDMESPNCSVHSYNVDDHTSYSSKFEEFMLESVPFIAQNLLMNIKKNKYQYKNDCELLVIDETLNCLMNSKYFHGMDRHKNYMHMDWNGLSNDPQEIYVTDEVIVLTPNTSKMLNVLIIPNAIGFRQRFVMVRVCPQPMPETDNEPENMRRIVETKNMITKLVVEFNCCIPDIIWDKKITMEEKLYAGEWYEFEMVFENPDAIGGFFYYDVVPNSSVGTMKFLNNKWKYFIEPRSEVTVPCAIEFKITGPVKLPGLLKFLGMTIGYPFHIEAFVLPPSIRFEPTSIMKRIKVLKHYQVHVYIDNVTPTTTWFRLDIKNEFISVYPNGAQLSPKGQGIFVTLSMFFYDPGIYHTQLDIFMQYENKMKIPITAYVTQMPIIFEPEVRSEDLHFQNILCVTEGEFMDGVSNFRKRIKVLNRGKKWYRIIFKTKRLSEKTTCLMQPLAKAHIKIEPMSIVMSPESEQFFDIVATACEQCTTYHEYWVQIKDVNDPKRVESTRFGVKATFMYPKVVWSKSEIRMNYYKTHRYRDHPQWEIIHLTNIADNVVDLVVLKVTGPFLIKLLFEDEAKKELTFSMGNLERKELFVILDKETVKARQYAECESRILCTANNRVQKALNLNVKVFTPELLLLNDNITIFAKDEESSIYVPLVNVKPLKAIYKWKKLDEEWNYISEKDNVEIAVELVLSEILHKLCLDDGSETNMTRHFIKYRCYLKPLDDPIDIRSILYDVINELNIERKRYKLDYESPEPSKLILEEIISPEEAEEKWREDGSSSSLVQDQDQEDGVVEERQSGGYDDESIRTTKVSFSQLKFVREVAPPKYGHHADYIHDMLDVVLQSSSSSDDDDLLGSTIQDLEDLLQEKTLYFNQQFTIEPSSSDFIGTSKETCVQYAVDHITNHLKLEDSYTSSLASTDTCNPERSIHFVQKCGMIEENQKEMCVLHLPPVQRGCEVKGLFQLDVVGGNSLQFNITLANVDHTLEIPKDNIYVGTKPWYETFKGQFEVENPTNYVIKIEILEFLPRYNIPKVADGYVKILNGNVFEVPPLEKALIKVEGVLGFNDDFRRECNITINDREYRTLQVNGCGIMPMLVLGKRDLPLVEQEPQSIIEDYQLLQKIYYFETFSHITEPDGYAFMSQNLEEEQTNVDDNVSITSSISETSDSSVIREKEKRFHRLLETYVFVINNSDLPNATVLDQLLQTEKLFNNLRNNRESRHMLENIYQNYEQSRKLFSAKVPINLRSFMIQPLPLELHGVVLNLGKVVLNEFRKFKVNLEFYGPGKLIASTRTTLRIPGLSVDFEIPENTGDKGFMYYQATDNQLCLPKLYRNLYERKIDAQDSPKSKQPHAYDVDRRQRVHQRATNIYERKCIHNYYNSLNKSIYADQKRHIIHSKIFTNCPYNISGTRVNLVILLKPEFKYYTHGQQIEDYLYVDVHMGTTLPILLRGTVVDRNRKDSDVNN